MDAAAAVVGALLPVLTDQLAEFVERIQNDATSLPGLLPVHPHLSDDRGASLNKRVPCQRAGQLSTLAVHVLDERQALASFRQISCRHFDQPDC